MHTWPDFLQHQLVEMAFPDIFVLRNANSVVTMVTATLRPPESASLAARLSWCNALFPPAEQKVAAYLLRNGSKHPDLTLAELAAHAKVSKPVVVRMCQMIGYSGFNEFRLQWAREHPASVSNCSDGLPDLADLLKSLHHTAELLSPDALNKAAQAIALAKQFFIYGSGGSGLIAQLAGAAFASLGRLPVIFNEVMCRMGDTKFADSKTTVLIISHRGVNQLIEEFVRDDKARGATVVTLTSNPQSPLAGISDVLLATSAPASSKSKQLNIFAARSVQIAALYTLAIAVRGLILQQSPTQPAVVAVAASAETSKSERSR